jgi:hypothetical protein
VFVDTKGVLSNAVDKVVPDRVVDTDRCDQISRVFGQTFEKKKEKRFEENSI